MSKYPDLVVELLKRGYSDSDVNKVIGGNLIRAMKKMEQVRDFPLSTTETHGQSGSVHPKRSQKATLKC